EKHVGAAAARHGPRAHHPHRRSRRLDRLPALRRHPRGQYRRDRRRGRDQDREEERDHPTGGARLRLKGRNLADPLSSQAAMRTARLFAAGLALLAPLWALAQSGPGTTVTTSQVRAELIAQAPEGVQAGKPLWVGLQITHQPEWHTYWRNPGDSGLPTELTWTLPAGIVAGDIAWPLPRRIPIGSLVNYGYEGTVLLPVPLTVLPDFKPSPLASELPIKLKATWLVCKKECIPEEGEFLLKLPVRSTTAVNGPAFDAALAAQPQPVIAGTAIIPDSTARIDG